MLKIVSEELPVEPLYADLQPLAHVSSVQGIRSAPRSFFSLWNIHEWQLS